jgi:SAM-dependent methyltransferase
MDDISPKPLNETEYTDRINSPSKSVKYFKQFHKPLIEEARVRGSQDEATTLLDLACGHGHELDPIIAAFPDVKIVGVDIAEATLISSTRERLGAVLLTPNAYQKSLEKPPVVLMVADVADEPVPENTVDVGIMVNAVIYKPEKMLATMLTALKPSAKCVVNFRNFSNIYNKPFYDYYLKDGAEIHNQELSVGSETFSLKVLDYNKCRDETIRRLDRQIYFQSTADIERLIRTVGFEIITQEPFHFRSPVNPDNEINVYTLKKPEQTSI